MGALSCGNPGNAVRMRTPTACSDGIFHGTDFLRYSRTHLDKAAHHLNERPHKALEFETRRSGVTAVLRRPVEIAGIRLSNAEEWRKTPQLLLS